MRSKQGVKEYLKNIELDQELVDELNNSFFLYHIKDKTMERETISFKNWQIITNLVPVLRRIARSSDFNVEELATITSFLNYLEAIVEKHTESKT